VSAAIVLFVVIPYSLLEGWHLVPHWDIFWGIYLLFPIIIAWSHAGIYMLLCVMVCELALVLLKPGVPRARIEAIAAVGVCTLLYLYNYLSLRFHL
jgi:hypothetical protein